LDNPHQGLGISRNKSPTVDQYPEYLHSLTQVEFLGSQIHKNLSQVDCSGSHNNKSQVACSGSHSNKSQAVVFSGSHSSKSQAVVFLGSHSK
jgi:hypothetical protein